MKLLEANDRRRLAALLADTLADTAASRLDELTRTGKNHSAASRGNTVHLRR